MTRGSWIWTGEIHFGSPGKTNLKPRLPPCVFTWSYGSDDTWLLLINDSDSLRTFGTSGTSTLLGFGHFGTLGGTVAKINISVLTLRSMVHNCFGISGFNSSEALCTSHFETLEVHFPERLDQLPPVPFKINNSYLLWGFGTSNP